MYENATTFRIAINPKHRFFFVFVKPFFNFIGWKAQYIITPIKWYIFTDISSNSQNNDWELSKESMRE